MYNKTQLVDFMTKKELQKLIEYTSISGGLNNNFRVVNLMMIADHISFLGMSGNNPLVLIIC